MEFHCYSPSETFVVLTADQFVGRDDGLLQQVHCVKFHRKPLTLDGLFETPRKAANAFAAYEICKS